MTEIQQADNLFSNFIRARAGWQCERCDKQFVPPTPFLQCAHFKKRSHKAVRFDPNNCVALCIDCHRFFDGSGESEFKEFMKKRLGIVAYENLLKKAQSHKKESEAVAEALAWLVGDKNIVP